jgi:hypothetical protein
MTKRSGLLFGFLPLVPVSIALLAACGDTGTTGALEQSSSRPECAPEDVACQSDGLDAPLAVGARLALDTRITAAGVAASKMTLESARADVLSVEGVTLIGKSPGWASIVMLNEEGLVLDFVTMTVTKPDRIELYRLTSSGAFEASPMPAKIQVAPGDDFELSVRAWSEATRLLGNFDATWTLNGDVATVLDSGKPGTRRFRMKQPGSATLTVEGSGFTKTLELEVLP